MTTDNHTPTGSAPSPVRGEGGGGDPSEDPTVAAAGPAAPPASAGSAPSPVRGEGGGEGPSEATDAEQRANLAAFIGPFPPEVSDDHLDWVRTAAGVMWARDQVSGGLRSAVTLGVLTALNAQKELALHIRRAATDGGLTRTEVAELLHHTAAYAGIPRSNDALRIAKDVFEQLDAEGR